MCETRREREQVPNDITDNKGGEEFAQTALSPPSTAKSPANNANIITSRMGVVGIVAGNDDEDEGDGDEGRSSRGEGGAESEGISGDEDVFRKKRDCESGSVRTKRKATCRMWMDCRLECKPPMKGIRWLRKRIEKRMMKDQRERRREGRIV